MSFGFSVLSTWAGSAQAVQTETVYLSGHGPDDAVAWEFCFEGARGGGPWTTLPVPSQWELQGYGAYDYGTATDESGRYRHTFTVPAMWQGKRVSLVFEGVMTDAEVWVNGQSAGPVHQGAFDPFHYDVTKFLSYGTTNRLDVLVRKASADPAVARGEQRAETWHGGGIYRPVYLSSEPDPGIQRVAITALADGYFAAEASLTRPPAGAELETEIRGPDGSPCGDAFSIPVATNGAAMPEADGSVRLRVERRVREIQAWSAESPVLYTARLTLRQGGIVRHQREVRFGFRAVRLTPGAGLFLNGQRLTLRGVTYAATAPDRGRCLGPADYARDLRCLQALNANAVRPLFPPAPAFLDQCDAAGIYVLLGLPIGNALYAPTTASNLVQRLVAAAVNHPSVILWGGGDTPLPALSDAFAQYDPQQRPVLFPGASTDECDARADPDYDALRLAIAEPIRLTLPTALLAGPAEHGLAAGLADYWPLLTTGPSGAGAFLHTLTDDALQRTDGGRILDRRGGAALAGVFTADRLPTAAFASVRALWSPVQPLTNGWGGDFESGLPLRNAYLTRNLASCRFRWELVRFPAPLGGDARMSGTGHRTTDAGWLDGPAAGPGEVALLAVPLPANAGSAGALYISAYDQDQRLLHTWSWPLRQPPDYAAALPRGIRSPVRLEETGDTIWLAENRTRWGFDRSSGRLAGVELAGRAWRFGNGPTLTVIGRAPRPPAPAGRPGAVVRQQDDGYVIEAGPGDGLDSLRWLVRGDRTLELHCVFTTTNGCEACGLTFDFAEPLLAKTWLGTGPFPVWRNRSSGMPLDVCETPYNDRAPGDAGSGPGFKGYFADFYWARFTTEFGPLSVAALQRGLYLRVQTPVLTQQGDAAAAALASGRFPAGDLSFLLGIPPTGTRLHAPGQTAPPARAPAPADPQEIALLFRLGD